MRHDHVSSALFLSSRKLDPRRWALSESTDADLSLADWNLYAIKSITIAIQGRQGDARIERP